MSAERPDFTGSSPEELLPLVDGAPVDVLLAIREAAVRHGHNITEEAKPNGSVEKWHEVADQVAEHDPRTPQAPDKQEISSQAGQSVELQEDDGFLSPFGEE